MNSPTNIDSLQLLNDTIVKMGNDIHITLQQTPDSTLSPTTISIIAILITGVIALYQVKMNIITKARVEWIESLRETLCEYFKEASTTMIILKDMLGDSDCKNARGIEDILTEDYPKFRDANLKIMKLASKIRLYLNNKEEKHIEIENTINKIDIYLNNSNIRELKYNILKADIDHIILLSREIINEEWAKTKNLFIM
jgi:hypothetical protein